MKSLKFRMILTIFFQLIFSLSAYSLTNDQNTGLSIGEPIPNPEISPINKNETSNALAQTRLYDIKQDKVLLIAFMPSVSEIYSDVMTTAFETYFSEGLSFRSFQKYLYENPELEIIVVTPDDVNTIQSYMMSKGLNFLMASDKDMNISNLFGITGWNRTKAGSTSYVYIADKGNKIVYADYGYKGQGEKLKTVQSELFSLFDLKENIVESTQYTPLFTGDKERDFDFQYITFGENDASTSVVKESRLSDYIGKKNILIAFYPAAYSYSCSAEITTFDHWAEDRMLEKIKNSQFSTDDLEILMVSVSNPYILSKWKNELNLNNVKLVTDNNGAISQMYNSFSYFGYNKGTVFLIDKDGIVSYINWDYKVDDNDFTMLKENVTALK